MSQYPFERRIVITLQSNNELTLDAALDQAVSRIKQGETHGGDEGLATAYSFHVDTVAEGPTGPVDLAEYLGRPATKAEQAVVDSGVIPRFRLGQEVAVQLGNGALKPSSIQEVRLFPQVEGPCWLYLVEERVHRDYLPAKKLKAI
ncbi:hypothetical protein NS383_17530 [Pseudomonas oryzihabitans]|nr:hypothetical protein NS383_17530 [Pseudomonas psychrotolerans]